MGRKTYAPSSEISKPVDMVGMFRAASEAMSIVDDAPALVPDPPVHQPAEPGEDPKSRHNTGHGKHLTAAMVDDLRKALS